MPQSLSNAGVVCCAHAFFSTALAATLMQNCHHMKVLCSCDVDALFAGPVMHALFAMAVTHSVACRRLATYALCCNVLGSAAVLPPAPHVSLMQHLSEYVCTCAQTAGKQRCQFWVRLALSLALQQ